MPNYFPLGMKKPELAGLSNCHHSDTIRPGRTSARPMKAQRSGVMKMGKVAAAATLGAILAMNGCASIVSTSKPKVNIYALPQVTTYTIKDSAGKVLLTGQTPGAAILETSRGYFKRQSYSITFSADGYSDSTQVLKPTISGWYWWNILLGGAVGMLIVDPLTGAMYTLPDEVVGTLKPVATSAPSPLAKPAQTQQ